jgi:hypothetical protein
VEGTIQELNLQMNKETDPTKKAALKTQISGLEETALTLNRYVETERIFLEKMYRFYTPQ